MLPREEAKDNGQRAGTYSNCDHGGEAENTVKTWGNALQNNPRNERQCVCCRLLFVWSIVYCILLPVCDSYRACARLVYRGHINK